MTPKRAAAAVVVLLVLLRLAILAKMMTSVDDIGPLIDLTLNRNTGMFGTLHYIGTNWSYAPATFALTKTLLFLAHDYESTLFWGRLPSVLFWATGIYCAFLLSLKVFRKAEFSTALATLVGVLLAVSWRGLIESSQGYNYAATLPVAAVVIWTFCFTERRRPFAMGLSLGLLSWITYQAIFLGAAWFLGWLIFIVADRDRKAVGAWLRGGVGFVIPVIAIFFFSLRLWSKNGVPEWAQHDVPGAGLLTKVTFAPAAWFRVVQNNFTFVPWGIGSVLIAIAILAITAYGLVRRQNSADRDSSETRLQVYVASVVVVWTVGAYLHRFPLGTTRHSYILQLPIAMVLALSVSAFRPDKRFLYATSALIVLVFGLFAPHLYRLTVSRIDMPLLEAQARANPSAAVIDPFFSFTWDQMLMSPDLRTRAFEAEHRQNDQPTAWDQVLKVRSRLLRLPLPPVYEETFRRDWETVLSDPHTPSLILVSHRARLTPEQRGALAANGFATVQPITEVEPFNLANRQTNGMDGGLDQGYFFSNGFFLYLASRTP